MIRRISVFLVVLLAGALLQGQLDRGSLTGTVTDPTGGLIPGAKVAVINTATQARYETVSSSSGQYTVPNLPPGPYQIVFEAPGMKQLVRSGIDLSATEVLRVDVSLEVGAMAERVEVSAEAPRLQTDRPEVGTSLSNRELIDLPLSFSGARKPENFAYSISPGVMSGSIAGSSDFSKETLLEGASTTTYMQGDFELSVSVESLQEFKIQTSGISAEYGRVQTGVFNYVMKSGTNDIHGSGFLSLRNEALNANTFVNNFNGQPRARDRQRDWAASFGGPVYIPKVYDGHNRSFFYVAVERYHQDNNGLSAPSRSVPLPEMYDGNLSRLLGSPTGSTDGLGRPVLRGAIYDPNTFRQLPSGRWIGDVFTNNTIPTGRISKVAARMNAMAKQSILPTVVDANGQSPLTNNAVFPSPTVRRVDFKQFSIKGDEMISNSHKLSGMFSTTTQPRVFLDKGGLWDVKDEYGGPLSRIRQQNLTAWYARLAHDWTVSPTILNHLTIFYNRQFFDNAPAPDEAHKVDQCKAIGLTGLTCVGFPDIEWGNGPFVTYQGTGPLVGKGRKMVGWGFLDTVSFARGRHFLKAGFDLRRNHYNNRQLSLTLIDFQARATAIPNEAFSGNLTGFSFASYLLGIVDHAFLDGTVPTGERRFYYSTFFQDDFKASSRLTLNLGLRWEYQPPFFEVGDRVASWTTTAIDPISKLPGAYQFAGNCSACTGKRYFGKPSWRNFGPRIGFAWQPLPKWALRGSYGIMYEGDIFDVFSSGTPLGIRTSVQAVGTYPLDADALQPWAGVFNWDNGFPVDRYVPPTYNASWGNFNRPGMVDPEYGRTGYIQQWNFNLQRELPSHLVLDVGYVGNKGTGLRNGDLAQVDQLQASLLAQYGTRLNNAIRSPADAAANGIPYPFPGFVGTVASALRPYPQVQGNSTVQVYGSPLGFSTYHALQVTVNRQLTRGLTAYGNYVWSKGITNTPSSKVTDTTAQYNPLTLDYYNLGREKAVAPADVPHAVKAFVAYQLPALQTNSLWGKTANAVIGSWAISAILNYYSGRPLGFTGSMPLSGGWNGQTNRANVAAGDMHASGYDKSAFSLAAPSSSVNTYLNKSLFSDPAPLTLGTSAPRYTQIRGFGTINEDVGLEKHYTVAEKYRIQLRAEFLNAFNRRTLGGINTNVTNALFGQVTSASGNRTMQIGLRLDF